MMTTEENKQIARRAFEALMARGLSRLQDMLAPNAVLHQCGFLEPIPVQAIMSGEFPRGGPLVDRQVHLERMIGEGELVAMHWRTAGRYSDPDSPELDGKRVGFPSMSFIRFEGGKIAEIWNIQDTATLQTQLCAPVELAGSK
jgi:ketosteroid isomerase-like protein